MIYSVKVLLEWISGKEGEKGWNGFSWLRIGTRGGLF
jgi:hypothetical protein